MSGEIDDPVSEMILDDIRFGVSVTKKYTAAIDSLPMMDAVFATGARDKQQEVAPREPVPAQGVRFPFSIQSTSTRPRNKSYTFHRRSSRHDSRCDQLFQRHPRRPNRNQDRRRLLCTHPRHHHGYLGIALPADSLIRSPRKTRAYVMASVFSGPVVLLGMTAVISLYTDEPCVHSLCGFFAEFSAIASLNILVLDAAL
jgi:hypothetical protein